MDTKYRRTIQAAVDRAPSMKIEDIASFSRKLIFSFRMYGYGIMIIKMSPSTSVIEKVKSRYLWLAQELFSVSGFQRTVGWPPQMPISANMKAKAQTMMNTIMISLNLRKLG